MYNILFKLYNIYLRFLTLNLPFIYSEIEKET